MFTMSPTFLSSTDDTLRLPRQTAPRAADLRAEGPALDATRLWTGGMATAAVAALVALVGMLVVRVIFQTAPVGAVTAHAVDTTGTAILCLAAAGAALAATGVAHLLVVSTPDPLAYLGWIIGLSTTVAVVLPLLAGTPLVAAFALAIVHLVTGLAIGSLVVGTTDAATRPVLR